MIDKNFECRHRNYYNCDFDKDGKCKNCDREISNRKKLMTELKSLILNHSNKKGLFDRQIFADSIANTIEKHNVRLEHKDIRSLCDLYFNNGEQSAERLNESDQLFREIDHYNSMLLNPINENSNEDRVRLGYL